MVPRRILAVSHMFPSRALPRHGIFIVREAALLRRHGVELAFLVPRPWAPWPLPLVPRWRSYGPSNPLLVPPDVEAREVRYLRPPGLGFRRLDGLSAALALLPAARRWHAEAPFHAVLGVSMLPDAEAAVHLGARLGLPVASLAVGSDVLVYPARLPALRRQLSRVLAEVDLPVGVSGSICDALRAVGPCRREPLCVYLGRSEGGFVPAESAAAPRARLGWQDDAVVLTYVGGLLEAKGVLDLAEAALPLLRADARLRLVFVGDGPCRARLQRLGRDAGRPDAVALAGAVAPEAVPTYLQASDALVLPSHSEGMPQVVLEAMSCGLPVVATRVGGVPEAVLHGETGLLVAAGDVPGLREALRRVTADGDFRRAAGRRGAERARQVFDPEANAATFAAALRGLGSRP
jgi:glycosyltransferase involved in cell wall biosynthesis